jgi:hypothetical protein
MNFTPGDWEAMPPATKGKRWRIGARGKLGGKGSSGNLSCVWYLATIANGAPGDTLETEANNARLMAASKRLLSCLKSLVERYGPASGYTGEQRAELLIAENLIAEIERQTP